jgi:hypothetical protein
VGEGLLLFLAWRCQYVKVQCRISDKDWIGSIWKEAILAISRHFRDAIELNHRMTSFTAEIRTQHLQNTSLEIIATSCGSNEIVS